LAASLVFVERTLQLSVAISVSLSVLLAVDTDLLNYFVLDVLFAARAVVAVLIVVLMLRLSVVVYNSIILFQHRFFPFPFLICVDLLSRFCSFCLCSLGVYLPESFAFSLTSTSNPLISFPLNTIYSHFPSRVPDVTSFNVTVEFCASMEVSVPVYVCSVWDVRRRVAPIYGSAICILLLLFLAFCGVVLGVRERRKSKKKKTSSRDPHKESWGLD